MLSILLLTLALSTPLILASMGGFASERSGVINIALEGLMLSSACVVAISAPKLGSFGSVLLGIGVAVLLALLHWLATQHYRIDHVVSGMAINALAAGGTNYLFGRFGDPNSSGIPTLNLKVFESLAFLLPFLVWLYVANTRGGLRLLAVGSDPEKARLAGLDPVLVRFGGLCCCGVLTGLGGAALISYTGVFTTDMTAGRGYIALATLILGGWRPLPAFGACIAFGFLNALRLQLEGQTIFSVQPPSQLWASLPYLATVIALAGFLGKSRTPGGLGKY